MSDIPFHTHNNTDTPKIKTEYLQFPIVSAAPTDAAPNGTVRVMFDGSTTYRIYVRVNNAWKYATLS
jgi:hypothetical protein